MTDYNYQERKAAEDSIGVQDTVQTAILGLTNYVTNSKERLLIAARAIEEDKDREAPNEYKKRKKSEKKTQWTQKQLHRPIYQANNG